MIHFYLTLQEIKPDRRLFALEAYTSINLIVGCTYIWSEKNNVL